MAAVAITRTDLLAAQLRQAGPRTADAKAPRRDRKSGEGRAPARRTPCSEAAEVEILAGQAELIERIFQVVRQHRLGQQV